MTAPSTVSLREELSAQLDIYFRHCATWQSHADDIEVSSVHADVLHAMARYAVARCYGAGPASPYRLLTPLSERWSHTTRLAHALSTSPREGDSPTWTARDAAFAALSGLKVLPALDERRSPHPDAEPEVGIRGDGLAMQILSATVDDYDPWGSNNMYYAVFAPGVEDDIRHVKRALERRAAAGAAHEHEIDRGDAVALLDTMIHHRPRRRAETGSPHLDVCVPLREAQLRARQFVAAFGSRARFFTTVGDITDPYRTSGHVVHNDDEGNCHGHEIASLVLLEGRTLAYFGHEWAFWTE